MKSIQPLRKLNWQRVCAVTAATLLSTLSSWAQIDATTDFAECDRYASIDDIPNKGIKKASYGVIDVDLALSPCLAAHKSNTKNSRVQAQLAVIYLQQGKFEQSIELAKTSAKERPVSLAVLGEASRRGIGGMPFNPRESVRLFQEGADRGSTDAMLGLARAYAIGIGVEKDESKALLLLQKATAMGDLNSLINLALAHSQGKLGLSRDLDEAINLIRKPAESGTHAAAEYLLAILIVQREKKVTPEAKAMLESSLEKLQRLANQNSAGAMSLLATCYRFGLGVAKDPAKAFALNRKAAEQNLIVAVAQVGIAFAEGIGTEKNMAEARKFLERASVMGSDEADKALTSLWGK